MPKTKVCIACGRDLPMSCFHVFYSTGCRFNTCKECVRKAVDKRTERKRREQLVSQKSELERKLRQVNGSLRRMEGENGI